MVLLIIGLACIVAGVVLLLINLPGVAVVAFVVGAVLVLASLIRRGGRRARPQDGAILGSINS